MTGLALAGGAQAATRHVGPAPLPTPEAAAPHVQTVQYYPGWREREWRRHERHEEYRRWRHRQWRRHHGW